MDPLAAVVALAALLTQPLAGILPGTGLAPAGVVSGVVEWTRQVFGPWGAPGLFVVALFEANVLPFAVDPLIVFFALGEPGLWPWWGLVATAGSVAGSLLGYLIGLKGGRPVLVRLVGARQAASMERYYARWGTAAVFITAVTLLPYKAFTIGSGVLELDLKRFTLAATAGRGLRFFAVAYATFAIGDEVLVLLDRWFWPTLVASAVLVSAWALWAWRRQRRRDVASPGPPSDDVTPGEARGTGAANVDVGEEAGDGGAGTEDI